MDKAGDPDCGILDIGHRRELDVAIELPKSPLEAVMSNEVLAEIYHRLAELIQAHRTTLVLRRYTWNGRTRDASFERNARFRGSDVASRKSFRETAPGCGRSIEAR